MSTRYVLLSAILLGAFVSGCAVPGDAPDGAEPAPAPHPKMTKAELLVGTWKLVKRTPPNSRGSQLTREYTKDGKVIDVMENPQDGLRIFGGTYRVDGDTLFQDFNTEVGLNSATIKSITADKLVISGAHKLSGESYAYEYERVRGK